MGSGRKTAQMRQGRDQSDGAVAAHAEIAHVVEKDNTGCGCGIVRCAEQGADDHFGAARLIEDRSPKAIVSGAKYLHPRLEAIVGQRRTARDHNTCGLAGSVGIDDLDSSGETDAIRHVRIVERVHHYYAPPTSVQNGFLDGKGARIVSGPGYIYGDSAQLRRSSSISSGCRAPGCCRAAWCVR